MPSTMNTITENFKKYLHHIGYSKSTANTLPACVLEFLKYNNVTHVQHIKQEHIQSFYEYLQNRPHKKKSTTLSEAFITYNIYGLTVFLNWLEQTGQIIYNPISNLKFKRPKINTREPLSQKEIEQLFENTKTAKERAILHLFYSCGLRRTEAEQLNTSDIHFTKNLLYVRQGKGAKRRVIPITERVKLELENYYNTQEIKLNSQSQDIEKEAFILNKINERMSGNSYNNILKDIIKRTDIEKEISLHHLRHSIATHLLENGLSIEFVRDFLGHSYLEATQIYAKVHYRMMNFK